MKENPLSADDALNLIDGPERLFASLFFNFNLDRFFHLFHERRNLTDERTHRKALPDFEIIPIDPAAFAMAGGFIEVAQKRLNVRHKNKQRQAVFGWLRDNPHHFSLELTREVLEANPKITTSLEDIFRGETRPESVQGKIAALIHSLKNDRYS